MPEPNAPLLASALKLLRTLLEWDQGALARVAGVDRSTIRRWEAGDVALDRERLEALATRMGATPAQVAAAVAFAEARAARELEEGGTCGPTAADPRRELAEQAVCAADGELRRFLEATRRAADRAAEREEAAARWRELRELPQEAWPLLIDHCQAFQTPGLCARLCDESVRAAARSASDAVRLAGLALRAAELLPGLEGTRRRAEGSAHAFVGNSLRVANELPTADLAFARCHEVFPYGTDDETGLFPEARVLDLEASLRRNQGKFGEALALLNRALSICSPSSRARVLLKQAATFEQSGDPERALAALREASPAIDLGEGGPRLRWVLRFNVVKILLQLNQAGEAAAVLPALRQLGKERGDRLSALRLRWLEASVAASLGRPVEALAEMGAVRQAFAAIPLPADAALVGLHEAEILLRSGQTARVRELVAEMQPIFAALGLELEALAAVRLFVEAAEREAATVEMAREAARCLCRVAGRG